MKKSLLFILCFVFNVASYAQTALWGTTSVGVEYNAGVIFKTDASGTNYTVKQSLFQFDWDLLAAHLRPLHIFLFSLPLPQSF